MRGVVIAFVLLFSTPLFSAELVVRMENQQPKTLVYDQLVSQYPQSPSQPSFHGTQMPINSRALESLTCSSSLVLKTRSRFHSLLLMIMQPVPRSKTSSSMTR